MTVAVSQLELNWFGQDWVALGRSSPPAWCTSRVISTELNLAGNGSNPWFCCSELFSRWVVIPAVCKIQRLHALPIPPVVDITRGVNVPCSTSLTLRSYCRLFSCSCFLYVDCKEVCLFDRAQGLKTITSTNALSKGPPMKSYITFLQALRHNFCNSTERKRNRPFTRSIFPMWRKMVWERD